MRRKEALALCAFRSGALNPTSNSQQPQQISVVSGLAVRGGKVHPGRAAVAHGSHPDTQPLVDTVLGPTGPSVAQEKRQGKRGKSKSLPMTLQGKLSQQTKSPLLSWSRARGSTFAVTRGSQRGALRGLERLKTLAGSRFASLDLVCWV